MKKLWQFSSYLVQQGFKIVEVGGVDKFLDGDFQKVPECNQLVVRACGKGALERYGNCIAVHGKLYYGKK